MSPRVGWPLLALALLLAAAPLQAQKGKGKLDPLDALVERYFTADEREPEGRAERATVLAELDALSGPLSAKDVAAWRKKLQARWEQGRKLKKDDGRRWWWEDEERGLYIVGGEVKKPKGLFLGMHGGGVGAGEADSASSFHDAAASKLKWLAIYPEVLEKTEHGWTDAGTEEFVIDLVEAARRTWGIDPDRVVFGGHSMGGYGSWTLGAHHADMVAAIVPSAGAPTPLFGQGGAVVGIIDGIIPSLRNVAIVAYQSDDDPQVPPAANRAAAKAIEEARAKWGGYDFEYWEVSGRGHDEPPGGPRAHMEKVKDKLRAPHAQRVVWQPALDWKRQFYWLWWEQPLRGAIVDAELLPAANTVRITLDRPAAGLHVLLDERLLDVTREVVVELNGKERFRGVPEARLSTLLLTGVRGDPRLSFACRVPVVVRKDG